MISIAGTSSETVFVPPPQDQDAYSLTLTENEVVLAAGNYETYVVQDAVFERSLSANIRVDGKMFYAPANQSRPTTPEFYSANPAIASVDNAGNVHTLQNGNVDIFCRAFKTVKKRTHNARFQTPVTSVGFLEYVEGSVGRESVDAVNALINEGGDKDVFAIRNPSEGIYARNQDCWASSLDWTGVSPHNSYDNFRRGGTLVSPRHLVWANHFGIPNGTTMTFVDQQNNVATRTISNSLAIAGSDVRVGVLNADVPESIYFYPVLPVDWDDYWVTVENTLLPLIAFDQQHKALCRELRGVGALVDHSLAVTSPRQSLSESFVLGDSGQPLFIIINNAPVLLGVHYTIFGSSRIDSKIAEINAAMTTLGGGYQLTEVDLSGFTDFSS